MKKIWMKRAAAAVLTAAMGVGLCACGSADSVGGTEGEHYFNTTYIDSLPDNFENMGTSIFRGDELYYTAYSDDYNSVGIYAFDLVDGTEREILKCEGETSADGVTIRYSGIYYFTVDDDGNIYAYLYVSEADEESLNQDFSGATLDDVLAYMVDNWGYEENEAAQDWDSWYKDEYTDEDGNVNYGAFLKERNLTYDSHSYLQKLDTDGNVLFSAEMDGGESDDYYISCFGIAVDGDGNLYCGMNKWMYDGSADLYYVEIYDEGGDKKGQIDFDDWTSTLLTLADGRVGCVTYGSETLLSVMDVASLSVKDTYQVSSEYVQPYDGTTVLMNDSGVLYLYNLEDQSKEEFVTWMDCNISSSGVDTFGMLSDGTLGVLIRTWGTNGYSVEIAILTEVDESEVVRTETINVACMWLDSDIEAMAIEFNKKHEEYHISFTQYYDDSLDWDDMLDAFTTAIANDPDIDIVLFYDYGQVANFASKGLLMDLYEFIDNDSELSRDDFLSNILTACEFDSALLTLPTSFSLSTVVGKTEDVGTEPGWTIDDMKALLASKPEGTELFYGMTREQALQICLNLGYREFIDAANATCSFDSQEFIDVLEFANMFPEEFTYEEDVEETDLLNSGQVLLSQFWLSDLEEIQLYTVVFGGELTYIGYPTSEGSGALLSLNNLYGITNNCENPEAAWEFVREFYLPEDEDDDSYSYGFSVRKDEFDKDCAAMMEESEYGSYSWGWGSYEVQIQPATQEQVDQLKELVNGTTAVSGAFSDDMMNLILEEAAYYFSGEQTAADVAAKIQSRMEIYLSETE